MNTFEFALQMKSSPPTVVAFPRHSDGKVRTAPEAWVA